MSSALRGRTLSFVQTVKVKWVFLTGALFSCRHCGWVGAGRFRTKDSVAAQFRVYSVYDRVELLRRKTARGELLCMSRIFGVGETMAKRRILLVDDEHEFTEALGKRLRLRGMVVETASSGREALEKVRGAEFDVCLLDLSMPGWDGLDTLKHLKSETENLQIVLLTGCATVRNGVDAMKLGAVDVLEKPADFEALLSLIDEAGARRDRLKEEAVKRSISDIARKHGW